MSRPTEERGPSEGQNECCHHLERTGWTYDGHRSGEMESLLSKKPIYVYNKPAPSNKLRRAIVGRVWITLYIKGHEAGIVMRSYKVDAYLMKEKVDV